MSGLGKAWLRKMFLMDEEMSGWEVVPCPRDLRWPGMVGLVFGFKKRIHTEGAGLSKAGDLGTSLSFFPQGQETSGVHFYIYNT